MKRFFLLSTIFMILTGSLYSTAWARGRRHKGHRWYEFWQDRDEDHDDEHDDEHDEHESRSRGRRFYKVRRISEIEAREIVLDTAAHWYVGDGWEKRKKKRTNIIIPLLYHGQIIGDIQVHPATGRIMPEKFKHSHKLVKISLDQARATVQQALPRIIVGNKIKMGKHGSFWEVPLILDGKEVEEIKVGTGSGNILPDLHVEEEGYYHRQPRSFKRRGPH